MEFHLLSPAESSTTEKKNILHITVLITLWTMHPHEVMNDSLSKIWPEMIKSMKLRLSDYDNSQRNINIIVIM